MSALATLAARSRWIVLILAVAALVAAIAAAALCPNASTSASVEAMERSVIDPLGREAASWDAIPVGKVAPEVGGAAGGEPLSVVVTLASEPVPSQEYGRYVDMGALARSIEESGNRVLAAVPPDEFSLVQRYSLVPALVGDATPAGVEALATQPDVIHVGLNGEVYAELAQAVPLIGADDVHDVLGVTGDGVVVAVLDTGIDGDHPLLIDDINHQRCFLASGACPGGGTTGPSAKDGNGHGTHVSGIITSAGPPVGVAPDALIDAFKVLDDSGAGRFSDLLSAYDEIISSHPEVDVINMSLSDGASYSPGTCDGIMPALTAAVATTRAMGITTFAASGNSGSKAGVSFPACINDIVSVGAVYDANVGYQSWGAICADATTAADKVVCFSQSDISLDLLAPGAWIESTVPGGGLHAFAGTSMASPAAAAVAALLLESEPSLTPAEIETRLKETGVPVTDGGNGLTACRVDAYEAVIDDGGPICEPAGPPATPTITPSSTPTPCPPAGCPTPTSTATPTDAATPTATPVGCDQLPWDWDLVNCFATESLWHRETSAEISGMSGGMLALNEGCTGPDVTGCEFNTGETVLGRATSPAFDAPGGAVLSFKTARSTENMCAVWDRTLVLYSADGGATYAPLDLLAGSITRGGQFLAAGGELCGESLTAQTVTLQLPPGTTNIAFEFDSVDPRYNHFPGQFIDDVDVAVCPAEGCSTPTPTATPTACAVGANLGFEEGNQHSNIIPCWTEIDQSGGSQGWCNQAGFAPPQGACLGAYALVAPPREGLQAAMTNQSGPGSHVLYRCFVPPLPLLSFDLYIMNRAAVFSSPDTLDYGVIPNQQFRADLVAPADIAADPFTVAPEDVLLSIYQTQAGDPPAAGYSTVTADVSAYVGETVCLRFAVADNQSYFHAAIDNIRFGETVPPTATVTPTPTLTPTPRAKTNDLFADAVPIGEPLPYTNKQDTAGASAEPEEPVPPPGRGCSTQVDATVWYRYTASSIQNLIASTFSSAYDTQIVVWSGTSIDALTFIGCNDDFEGSLQSQVAFTADPGTTYYFQLDGYKAATGHLAFSLTEGPPPPAKGNDDFADAILIPGPLPYSNKDQTAGASLEQDEPQPCPDVIGRTVWYSFTPVSDVLLIADTEGSSFDTTLAAYTGDTLATLSAVDCDDDGGTRRLSRLAFAASGGTTYHFQVGGFRGDCGDLVFNLAAQAPPTPTPTPTPCPPEGCPTPPAKDNDDFANAVVVPDPLPYSNTQAPAPHGTEHGEPWPPPHQGCDPALSGTFWYAYTSSSDQTIIATLSGGHGPQVVVWKGTGIDALGFIGCDGAHEGPQAQVTFAATAGTTYYFQLEDGAGSVFSLRGEAPPTPTSTPTPCSPEGCPTPTPGLDFSLGIDTDGDAVDDCGTRFGEPTECAVLPGSTFSLNVHLNDLPVGVAAYEAVDIVILGEGVTSKDNPTFDPWPDCVIEASFLDGAGWLAFGCSSPIGLGGPSTYLGHIAKNDFNCLDSGTITMVHGDAFTKLTDAQSNEHTEGEGKMETLVVNCVEPTPTSTPTLSPTPTPPSVGGAGVFPDMGQVDRSGRSTGSVLGVPFAVMAVVAALGGVGWYVRVHRPR